MNENALRNSCPVFSFDQQLLSVQGIIVGNVRSLGLVLVNRLHRRYPTHVQNYDWLYLIGLLSHNQYPGFPNFISSSMKLPNITKWRFPSRFSFRLNIFFSRKNRIRNQICLYPLCDSQPNNSYLLIWYILIFQLHLFMYCYTTNIFLPWFPSAIFYWNSSQWASLLNGWIKRTKSKILMFIIWIQLLLYPTYYYCH